MWISRWHGCSDVHKATISVAVRDAAGKLTMESIIETRVATILEFVHALGGSPSITFEEGTGASWLYDLLNLISVKVIVCESAEECFAQGWKHERQGRRPQTARITS